MDEPFFYAYQLIYNFRVIMRVKQISVAYDVIFLCKHGNLCCKKQDAKAGTKLKSWGRSQGALKMNNVEGRPN